MYKVRDRIQLKKLDEVVGDICGIYPAGQLGKTENSYICTFNGVSITLTQEQIDALFEIIKR